MTTHTWILYLCDCSGGGATQLLHRLPCKHEAPQVLASVAPRRARLFVFPHHCPHAGAPLLEGETKVLARGDLAFVPTQPPG